MKPQPPCKNCVAPKRHQGCHDVCEEFIAYKEAKLQFNLEMGKIRDANVYFDERRPKCASKHRRK